MTHNKKEELNDVIIANYLTVEEIESVKGAKKIAIKFRHFKDIMAVVHDPKFGNCTLEAGAI